MIELELPWPPSVNHYYRRVGPRTLISRRGRQFREQVVALMAVQGVQPITGRVAVSIEAHPPDHRKRDLDNLFKSVIDAVQHGGAFPDDSRIIWLLIQRAQVVPGGKVVVAIRDMENDGPLPAADLTRPPSLN